MNWKIFATFFLYILTITEVVESQPTFQKKIDFPTGTLQNIANITRNNDFIIATGSPVNSNTYFFNLIRITEDADTIWTRQFEAGNWMCSPAAISECVDGSIIMFGYLLLPIHPYTRNPYLLKTDSAGNFLWAKRFNLPAYTYGTVMVPASDSGVVIMGPKQGNTGGPLVDCYLAKIDKNGNLTWGIRYYFGDDLFAMSMWPTNDGGYIVCGRSSSLSNARSFLLKVSSSGTVQWAYNYDTGYLGNVKHIRQLNDGHYSASGYFIDGSWSVMYLFKIDSLGIPLWMKNYDTPLTDLVNWMEVTTDNGYIFTGVTSGVPYNDGFIFKTDSEGDILWSKYFDTNFMDKINYFHKTTDKGLLLIGESDTSVYVIKTDSIGNSSCNAYNYPVSELYIDSVSFGPLYISSVSYSFTITNEFPIVSSGGTVTTLCSSVGNNNPDGMESIHVYPNPANDFINIKFPNNINSGKIEIINVRNQIVYSGVVSNTAQFQIQCNHLYGGIYILRYFDATSNFNSRILITRQK